MQPLVIDKNNLQPIASTPEVYSDGILIPVDKPYRWSSFDVVRKVKLALQREWHVKHAKIGHAGTLDPLATGLLILCIGKATKISEQLQGSEKEYIAQFTLGATTPSFDREHPINEIFDYSHITLDDVKKTVESMAGEQEQMPPLFSAKFIDGHRSYDLARSGKSAELKPCRITIYKAELLGFRNIAGSADNIPQLSKAEQVTSPSQDTFTVKKWRARASEDYGSTSFGKEDEQPPLLSAAEVEKLPVVTLRIACSKGTYIRSIARDFGLALGSGAYMSALKRVKSGGFKIEDSVTFDEFERIISV